ncbi:Protein of unknown function (DUF3563) (plasmid) [Paraburkholderia caribensis MBA4]|uniref:DUF3563 domain-containing protein n=2 Tax=Paraburkholderia caribensis TaxID=75105 RepID=A0A0P0RLL6_9BURK|nr:Protein of unknown function (DUF3563) [Paraburkholderia caribensis MBA4]
MARSMHMVAREPTQQEHPMFAYFIRIIFELLDRAEELLDRAEHHRRDAYLSSATDIFELERRMRLIEAAD